MHGTGCAGRWWVESLSLGVFKSRGEVAPGDMVSGYSGVGWGILEVFSNWNDSTVPSFLQLSPCRSALEPCPRCPGYAAIPLCFLERTSPSPGSARSQHLGAGCRQLAVRGALLSNLACSSAGQIAGSEEFVRPERGFVLTAAICSVCVVSQGKKERN